MNFSWQQIKAACDALGYDVGSDRVGDAFMRNDCESLEEAIRLLGESERKLASAGGRGVDLAEEVDDLRIVAAVLQVGPVEIP